MQKDDIIGEKIIQAAFDLLTETPDLKQLSMRKIAQKLDVQAPAIYWHIENKQALLQYLAEEIENHFVPPTIKENWRDTLCAYMENYYMLYQQYPCAVDIALHTIPAYPSRLENLEAMLTMLCQAGFSIETSAMAIASLQHLLFGMLIDATEEKTLYNQTIAGDDYLKKQIILMNQYVQTHHFHHVHESILCHQKIKQKDSFMCTLKIFINGLGEPL